MRTKKYLIVENSTRGQSLVSHGHLADTFFSRFKGLMGKARLAPGDGLLLVPSNAIHTHLMRFPIDVLYLDEARRVVAMTPGMKPWRIGRVQRRAHSVLELPAGVIAATGTQVGDQLIIRQMESLAPP